MLRRASTLAFRIVVVAGAYFVAGRLSNKVAIAPGYVTAVWPSAGIAMAAAIVWGSAILPGVFIGALGVNLFLHSNPYVAASIALGVTVQAALGAWITRRLAGPGNPLDGAHSALPTLFVGGPLSCLVSATWSVATMLAADVLLPRSAAFTWTTWWAGDTMGVLVFLPPVLAWSARPAELWRVRRWTLTAPLVACGAVVGFFFVYAQDIERLRVADEFAKRHRPIAEAIGRELTRVSDAVRGLASLFDASHVVDPDEFRVFTEPRLLEGGGLLALSWNPFVDAARRAEKEVEARSRGLKGYTFLERGPDGSLQPAGKRERYAPVFYIEPEEANRNVLGFDLRSEPVRAAALEASLTRKDPTATARLRLLHEEKDAWSVLLMMPVHGGVEVPDSRGTDAPGALGVVVGVVQITKLVESALERLDRTGLLIRIRDAGAPAGEQLLYGDEPERASSPPETLLREDVGRRWRIEVSPEDPHPADWSSWLVLAGCLLFTGLVGAFVTETATRQIHIERLVALRTSELARANEELQRSNLELQRFAHVASHDLREPLRAIGSYAQLLDESALELSPDHRKFLERIFAAARRMQALVDDLLALSRLEGGAVPMSRVPLRELVDLAIENLLPAIEASAATIEIGELPRLTCDPSQIVQLFQNLIANALKFRREGVPPFVRIDSRRNGAHWEISVTDNGIGISPEHSARIFEMFERLHAREQYGGTGIGLAICRRVVDRHGGRIWLDSEAVGGSVFRFTLRDEGEPS